jgi:hypothetical protein
MKQKIINVLHENNKDAAEKYMQELEAFIRRNSIEVFTYKKNKKHHTYQICERCFKAHAIRLAIKMQLGELTLNSIINSLKSKCGHEGYYLDNEKLRRIIPSDD